MEFKCVHCNTLYDSFNDCISHNIKAHPDRELTYLYLKLNPDSGKRVYKQRRFSVVPQGHTIQILPDQRISVTDANQTAKGNPPSTQDTDPADKSSEGPHSEIHGNDPEEIQLQKLLPQMVENLRKHGLLGDWISFHEQVANGQFPLENISLRLFLESVRFMGCSDIRQMRYSDETRLFWKTGYFLFHQRFLSFMSGPKCKSQDGNWEQENRLINFAVPCRDYLDDKRHEQADMKPGILHEGLKIMKATAEYVKVAFDSKKINSSLSVNHGDVDLFGCEASPTLSEAVARKDAELQRIEETAEKPEPTAIHAVVQDLSKRIRDMRQQCVLKNRGIQKLKELTGKDWRDGKYAYAISAMQCSMFQMNEAINSTLRTIDRLLQCSASMQGSAGLYREGQGSSILLSEQENYICLQTGDGCPLQKVSISPTIDRYILKQRTPEWFEVRSRAPVTASTAYAALGLDTLKKQAEHVNKLFGCSEEEHSEVLKKNLEYGQVNEVNALATLLGKVLPAYLPTVHFVEEGCYSEKAVDPIPDKPLLITSPDGSGRTTAFSQAICGFEFKCPVPKTHSAQVQYSIPVYYAIQLLAQMHCLQCNELLYLSYTPESTTVFRVRFSEAVWEHVWTELSRLYGVDVVRRPTKLGTFVKPLKEEMKEFLSTHVEFLAEIPSITGRPCHHAVSAQGFTMHVAAAEMLDGFPLIDLQGILLKAKSCIDEAYQLCRKRATELALFVMSDLDRVASFGTGHSIPVAYGLQGASLPADTLRKMLACVLRAADEQGVKPIVFSCDGAHIGLVVRDMLGKPLTTLQFQKQYWLEVKKMSKEVLVAFF
jgi:hypothetical protein